MDYWFDKLPVLIRLPTNPYDGVVLRVSGFVEVRPHIIHDRWFGAMEYGHVMLWQDTGLVFDPLFTEPVKAALEASDHHHREIRWRWDATRRVPHHVPEPAPEMV